MSAIFITGVHGLIGGILRYFGQFYDLRIGSAYDPGAERVVTADISDYPQVLEAMRACMPFDCTIHLVADASLEAPWHSVLHNKFIGTHNVYEAMRVLGVRKVVLASTVHVVLPSDGGISLGRGATPAALTALDVPPGRTVSTRSARFSARRLRLPITDDTAFVPCACVSGG